MKSIVEQGVKQAKRELSEKDKELQSMLGAHRTNIKIVGAGGAGNNTLSRMVEVGIAGVEIIAVNTDAQDLLYASADNKILIGKDITSGLGAGSNPEIGEESARENEEEIREALKDADMVFVTCGLGGGTGTGSAPVVAEIARSLGALTISVVTLPFSEEGVMRWENAHTGLEKLQRNSDTVIVIQNDKLLEIAPELPLGAAFKVADEVLVNAVKGITELVTEKGLVNLDFADVRAVMKDGGTAMVGIGESNSQDRALEAVQNALNNPLLDVDVTGARSALLNITGGTEMSLKDAKIAMKELSEKLDNSAKVIWGARFDDSMKDSVRILLIVTGLRKQPGSLDKIDSIVKKNDSRKGLASKSSEFASKDLRLTKPKTEIPDFTVESSDSEINDFTEVNVTEGVIAESMSTDDLREDKSASEDFDGSGFDAETESIVETEDESEDDLFDIRDEEDDEDEKLSEKKQNDRRNKRIFTEIFEEEAQGDLNILLEAIESLDAGSKDIKVIKDIKAACDSLKNTAQLFTFDKIEIFAANIVKFMDFLVSQDKVPVKEIKAVVEEIPDIINELMYEESEATDRAKEVELQLEKIKKSLQNSQKVSDSSPAEGSAELKKKLTSSFFPNKKRSDISGSIDESKMNDAMQQVKKLFG